MGRTSDPGGDRVAEGDARASSTLSEEAKRLARRRIVGAALSVLAERGLDVTVEDVAAEAGVGVRTIFRHFGTRDRLIAAAVRSRVSESPMKFRRPAPGEALEEWLSDLVAESHRGDELGRAYWEMATASDLDDELASAFAERQAARGKLVRWATKSAWALVGGRGRPQGWLFDAFALHLSPVCTAALAADAGRPQEALVRASVPVLAAAVRAAAQERAQPAGWQQPRG